MPDIRTSDIHCLVDVLSRGQLDRSELRGVLINKKPGVGSRFESLLDFLASVSVVHFENRRIVLSRHIELDEIEAYLIESILKSQIYARDFAYHCDSVQVVSKPKRAIVINSAHTNFRFLWFLSLLEQLGALEKTYKPFYKVTPEFEMTFLEFINHSYAYQIPAKGMTPEELTKRQLQNQVAGLEAEMFCIEYEKDRLKHHPNSNRIRHVALEDVSAGFDILSFDAVTDLMPKRKIEVKSWISEKKFYLSNNEYQTAKDSANNYYLYLVDRSAMNKSAYIPEIFQNPYDILFQSGSEWQIESDGWLIHGIRE